MVFEFRVLGPLQVNRDGAPVALSAAMLRRLLATLLSRPGQSVPATALIDALWDGVPPPSARKTFQVYVRRLRQALGEDGRIVHGADGYAAMVSPDELDAWRFSRLTAEGRAARERADLETAARHFEQALGLWRGTAYAGVETVRLVLDDVRRLEEERLITYEELTAVNLARGRHAELVADLTEMADLHPFRDRLRAYLMLALCRLGRQVEALAVYRRTRATLNEQLGVEPGQLLRQINEAILLDGAANAVADEVLGFTAETTWTPVSSGTPPEAEVVDDGAEAGILAPRTIVPRHLPPDIVDFTGRDESVASLRRLLTERRSTATPVVAVTGPAGTGKTTLAVHVAHLLRERFPDGQLYVDLRGTEAHPAEPSDVLARFLTALGMDGRELPEDREDREALLRSVLADRRVLMVLDNAADERQVRPLLPSGAGCAVVVTGRRRLAGLSAHHVGLDVLGPEQALMLLARVAGEEQVAAEIAVAGDIVRLCGHLPLAIRIAGARLAAQVHWSLGHLADRLRQERRRLDELAVGDLSVRASLALSYGALPSDTRRAFRLLGLVDAPDVAAWVLTAVLGGTAPDAERHIDRLVDARLLACVGTDGRGRLRYRFHDLVRLYARECAEAEESPGHRREAIARALGGWLAVAEAADGGLNERVAFGIRGRAARWTPDPAAVSALVEDSLGWFDAERINLRSAVAQACEEDLDELSWELSAVSVNYYAARGCYTDWAETHRLALLTCARAGNRRGEAVMIRNLACLRMTGLRTPAGMVLAKAMTAVETFQEMGERHGAVDLIMFQAFALRHLGEPDLALDHGDQAMVTAELIGYRLAQCRLWCLRAIIHRERGRYGEAVRCARRSLHLAMREGTTHDRVLALWELAGACERPRDLLDTIRRLRRCLGVCERRRERLLTAYLRLALSDLLLRTGRTDVEDTIVWSLEIMREYEVPFGQAVGLRLLGESHRLAHRPEQAIIELTQALRMTREQRNTCEQARTLEAIGRAHLASGDRAAAEQAWLEARTLFVLAGNTTDAAKLTGLIENRPAHGRIDGIRRSPAG